MTPLEAALRNDPRTQNRLHHARDAAAADAAVRFFSLGVPAPKTRYYGSETWRQIMEVFVEIASVPDPIWINAINNDHGSLRTGNQLLNVGQVIEIEGEATKRYVTSTMGSPDRFHAHFKKQGEVPLHEIHWRLVACRQHATQLGGPALDPAAPQQVAAGDTIPVTAGGEISEAESWSWSALIERIRKHPMVTTLALVAAVVITLGSLTDALEKIFQFIRKHIGN